MAVELHPDALHELRSAALWYDGRRGGLGDEFVLEITDCLQRIVDEPNSYPIWPGTAETGSAAIRRALVKRFPYAIAFEVHPDRVFVLTIAHAKRRPLFWLQRSATRRAPEH